MKILFAGTPQIAVPLLHSLAESFDVCAVLTAVDKMSGRSGALQPSPVKQAALELGIPVLQFEKNGSEAREAVSSLGADTLLSFAYGRIFGPKFLSLFDRALNVHPSDLPLLRGPSPIQSEILNCFHEAVICLQSIAQGVDEGDIWASCRFALDGTETTGSLTERVAREAAVFVPPVLKDIAGGKAVARRQQGQPTYCTKLEPEESVVDFRCSAAEVHAFVRAMYPWPKARASVIGRQIFITSVYGGFGSYGTLPGSSVPGQIVCFNREKGFEVACKDATVFINGLQLPTRKETDHVSFRNGNRWIEGCVFNG